MQYIFSSIALLKPFRNFAVALLFLMGPLCMAQLKTTIDTTQMRIGEELLWSLELEADPADIVMFPEGAKFGGFEVIRNYPIDTLKSESGARTMRLRKRYGLTSFDSGTYVLPPQRVLLGDQKFESDSLNVVVYSVVVDTTKQKLFDIKTSVAVPLEKTSLWLWILACLVLLTLAYLGLRWWKKRRLQQNKAPILPPFEEAMHRLSQVDQANLLDQGEIKAYYSELVDIVKCYVARAVDDRALESTTDELIQRFYLHQNAGHLSLKTATITHLGNILKRSDLIKFAKGSSAADQIQSDRQGIEQIIIDTKAALPEEEHNEDEEAQLALAVAQRRRRHKRRVIVASVLVLLLSSAGIVFYFGVENTKDYVFGNTLRDHVEGPWYQSAYGVPAIELETPDILKRQLASTAEDSIALRDRSVFEAYTLLDPLYISVSTTHRPNAEKQGLEQALDMALNRLEKQGAGTMLVKSESFETPEGLKGLRAHGTFYFTDEPGHSSQDQSTYELYVFGQEGGVQTVLVAYKDDEQYAQVVKDRIVNSIAIQVPEQSVDLNNTER